MSRQRFVSYFDSNSKLGVMKKRIIGTAEIKQIIAAEYLEVANKINQLEIDLMVKNFKNRSGHITKRIFVVIMEYLDVYVHRWGSLSEEVVTFMCFRGIDTRLAGTIMRDGQPITLRQYLYEKYQHLGRKDAEEKVRTILYKLKPQDYGILYAKNDYLKTGLSPIMARKLLTDIFQIDKSYLPSLVILINTIKLKDETIKSADFNIICTSLEWVMERTQHLTILELYTAIFLVLDSEYQGIVNVDKIHGFITGLIKDPSIDITSPNFQLVEFLHCAQQVSDNQLPITQFMRHISVPVLQINELQPLPYNQTHSFKQLQTTTKQQKDVDLDQLFKDFEIDSQLCSRIKQYVLGNEHEKFIKNKIVGIFNNNIHEYGKIEGIIRSLYSVLEQNGIDTEMLILTSRIFNTPIDMETAQLVIRGYVEDSSERLLMNDFVRFWMDLDSPRATDSQSTLETKQVLRTVSMYRVLQQNNKVTVLAIHSFLEKQYGIVNNEEFTSLKLLFNYISQFKGEMNFEEFKLFMKAYERCLDYSTLSLALTVKCICNGIWNNKQFKQIPKLFHVSEDVLEKFKQHCHTKTVAATPEEFSTFLMPYVQVQLF